jgi:hypothetical protein
VFTVAAGAGPAALPEHADRVPMRADAVRRLAAAMRRAAP